MELSVELKGLDRGGYTLGVKKGGRN